MSDTHNSPHESVRESLSALLDDEHSELDLRRILKGAEVDDEVVNTWQRYGVIRQTLQKQECFTERSLLDGVRDAIKHDEAPVVVAPQSRWQQWAGKVAVAACVTFAFLFGSNYWQGSEQEASAALASGAVNSNGAAVPSGFELPPLQARTVSAGADTTSYGSPAYGSPAYGAVSYGSELPADHIQIQTRAALHEYLMQNPELRAQLHRMLQQSQAEAQR
ncbi:sigma-E factor negative regulatory protein [Agaribacterium sp. ZY112]|uniref:sigma-E factor negative regulatory protein n=1 Tax=Agaribacterium sp. ZY112 TaxID=3233574 RepID=UPI00352552B5